MQTTPNGKAKAKVSKRPSTPGRPALARFKLGMTISLGIGIPLLSLVMSKFSGTLAAGQMSVLALFALALMLTVLGVSLPHLAWAISDITGSGAHASWSLAVALDLSLVLCEMIVVYASDLGLTILCYTVMVCVAIMSMNLNVYAFIMEDTNASR